MRILAIDHGTVRMGIALSDELKMIAQPLEFIPAEPSSRFLDRLKELLGDYQDSTDCYWDFLVVTFRGGSRRVLGSRKNRIDGTLLLPRFSGPPRGSRRTS